MVHPRPCFWHLMPCFLMLVTFGAALPVHAALEDGLTLYASFDEGVQPDFAYGSDAVEGGGDLAAGKVGQALASRGLGDLFRGSPGSKRIQQVLREGVDTTMAFYAIPGNLDVARGTLAFWYQAPRDFDASGPSGSLIDAVKTNFAINKPGGRAALMFMTGAHPGGGDVFAWDYRCHAPSDEVRRGEWVHIAVTWDREAQQKRLYINGRQAGSSETELIRPDGGSHIVVGAMPGRYDELGVWSRVLSATEIGEIVASPGVIASAARQVDDPSLELPPWPLYPSLVNLSHHPASLVDRGDAFSFDLPLENRHDAARRASVRVEAVDTWGRVRDETVSRVVALAEGESTTQRFVLRPERLEIGRAHV